VLNLAVDFHSRHLLSAGVPGSLIGAFGACEVSPAPYARRSQVYPLQSTSLKTMTFNTAFFNKPILPKNIQASRRDKNPLKKRA
jgi:hypothetical protein